MATNADREEQRRRRRTRMEEMDRLQQRLREQYDVAGLIGLLNSGDTDTVRAASLVLGDHGDASAVPALLTLLRTSNEHWLKDGAALALRDIGDPRAREPLLREIRDPANAGYTGTLIYALEPFDVRDAVVELVQFVCDGEYESAWMAVTVIRAFPGLLDPPHQRTALTVLERCLADAAPRRHGRLAHRHVRRADRPSRDRQRPMDRMNTGREEEP